MLKKEWLNTTSIDGKLLALGAMAVAADEKVISSQIVPFNFNKEPPSDSVPAVDMHALGMGLAGNPIGRRVQWEFMKNNWDACVAKLSNPIVLDRFVRVSLGNFTDEAKVDEIEKFFADKDTKSFDRTLETVKDKIRGRAAYRKRDAAGLREWLGANGYL